MRLFSVFIGLVFAAHAVSIAPGEVHYENDELLQRYYEGEQAEVLKTLHKYCYSSRPHREYFCYNAGVLEKSRGRREARQYFTEAVRINQQFAEAITLLSEFSADPLPSGLKEYEKAREAARAKKIESAIAYAEMAVEKGVRARELYANQPDFSILRNDSRFVRMLSMLPVADTKSVVAGFTLDHPLSFLINPWYTQSEHARSPDANEILYDYYEARKLLSGKQDRAKQLLKNFLEKLSSRAPVLAARAVLFLYQDTTFSMLKQDSGWKAYLVRFGEKNGLPGNWENKL